MSVSEAKTRLYRLVDEAADTHKPVLITGRRNLRGGGPAGRGPAGQNADPAGAGDRHWGGRWPV
ncbi:type II toxin-antitoxin system Phd/YefM family antitoxin [Acidithiobacillus sulfuriphilus]